MIHNGEIGGGPINSVVKIQSAGLLFESTLLTLLGNGRAKKALLKIWEDIYFQNIWHITLKQLQESIILLKFHKMYR